MKAVLVFLSAVRPFNNIMASFGDTPSHYFAFYLFFFTADKLAPISSSQKNMWVL